MYSATSPQQKYYGYTPNWALHKDTSMATDRSSFKAYIGCSPITMIDKPIDTGMVEMSTAVSAGKIRIPAWIL